MPCYQPHIELDEVEYKDLIKAKQNNAFLEAALCSTLKALELAHAGYTCDPLDMLDYEEAGILKEDLIKWKREHDEKDRIRIEEEHG
jgi:hypothetical protein